MRVAKIKFSSNRVFYFTLSLEISKCLRKYFWALPSLVDLPLLHLLLLHSTHRFRRRLALAAEIVALAIFVSVMQMVARATLVEIALALRHAARLAALGNI